MKATPVGSLLALIPILLVGVSVEARAEPIACLPGQRGCGEPIIEEKVRRSFDRAVYSFVGRLESVEDSRHGTASTRVFTFTIERQFKGTLAGDLTHVSINSHLAGGEKPGANALRSLGEFEQLETAAEREYTETDRNRYYERVTALRDDIRKNGAAEPAPTHVVQLDLSLGDIRLRMTDIPMRIGERYAVFVFNKNVIAPDPDTRKYSFVLMDPVDLYSMNGKRGKRALAALERVSGQKRQ